MYSRMEKQRCGKDRETTRRQERKREQEMLRFPLDVRCVCSCHARLLLSFITNGFRKSQEEKGAGSVKTELSFCYFVVLRHRRMLKQSG